MTIVEQILHEAAALPTGKRREALRLIRSMRVRHSDAVPAKTQPRKTLGKARAAIKAAKGMWRGRVDLPGDAVAASLELQRRLMSRDGNG